MAGWLSLPGLWGDGSVEDEARAVDVSPMLAPDVGYGRHHASGHAEVAAALVLVMWHVTSDKGGVSAQSLQRLLGFNRYETVWVWLHKLRRAMVRPGRDRLSGEVEVDETYVGGEEAGVIGRESLTKSIVGVAAEVRGAAIGRIRLRVLADVSAEGLMPFVEETVAPGAQVVTDDWAGYGFLEGKGYGHTVLNIKRSGLLAHPLLPRVHKVAALLKRWLLGTSPSKVPTAPPAGHWLRVLAS